MDWGKAMLFRPGKILLRSRSCGISVASEDNRDPWQGREPVGIIETAELGWNLTAAFVRGLG